MLFNNMNIREANKNDARSIANVQVKSWQFAYREIMPKEYLDSLSVQNKRAISVYKFNGFIFEGAEKFDKKLTGHELHEIRFVSKLS